MCRSQKGSLGGKGCNLGALLAGRRRLVHRDGAEAADGAQQGLVVLPLQCLGKDGPSRPDEAPRDV